MANKWYCESCGALTDGQFYCPLDAKYYSRFFKNADKLREHAMVRCIRMLPFTERFSKAACEYAAVVDNKVLLIHNACDFNYTRIFEDCNVFAQMMSVKPFLIRRTEVINCQHNETAYDGTKYQAVCGKTTPTKIIINFEEYNSPNYPGGVFVGLWYDKLLFDDAHTSHPPRLQIRRARMRIPPGACLINHNFLARPHYVNNLGVSLTKCSVGTHTFMPQVYVVYFDIGYKITFGVRCPLTFPVSCDIEATMHTLYTSRLRGLIKMVGQSNAILTLDMPYPWTIHITNRDVGETLAFDYKSEDDVIAFYCTMMYGKYYNNRPVEEPWTNVDRIAHRYRLARVRDTAMREFSSLH